MKRILTIFLALLMIVSLAACGKTGNDISGRGNSTSEATAGNDPGSGSASDSGGQSGDSNPEGAKLTGKLTLIDLDDRDPSILRGVRIKGLSVGSEQDINGKDSSLTDVRCVFELDEWIEFYPDTDAQYYLRVWVLKHRDDQEYYNKCKFSDLMPNFAAYCDLHYPVDEEKPDEWYWGNFYLNHEEQAAGYYDFVFTYEGKAIAVLQTRFYNSGEIKARSGAELEALMHE